MKHECGSGGGDDDGDDDNCPLRLPHSSVYTAKSKNLVPGHLAPWHRKLCKRKRIVSEKTEENKKARGNKRISSGLFRRLLLVAIMLRVSEGNCMALALKYQQGKFDFRIN